MIPYAVAYGFLGFLLLIEKKKVAVAFAYVFLAFFLNFSYTNGIDWVSYQYLFEYQPTYARGIEYGYTSLVLLFHSLGFNFELFKATILSVCLFYIFRFILQRSESPILTILVLFQTYLLGNFFEPAIRQIIAIAIFIHAFKYLVNKDSNRYILLIVAASFFHQSAIVLILLPLVARLVNLPILIMAFLVFSVLVPYAESFLLRVSSISIFSDYAFYAGKSYMEGAELTVFNLAKAIIYVVPIYLLRNYERKNSAIEILRLLSILFVFFYLLQLSILLFYRINHYFIIFYVVYISFLLRVYKSKVQRFVVITFFFSIHAISLYKGITYYKYADSMKYYPYTNYIHAYLTGNVYDSVSSKIADRLYHRNQDRIFFNPSE